MKIKRDLLSFERNLLPTERDLLSVNKSTIIQIYYLNKIQI